MVYGAALVKAVSEKNPEYFRSNTQFKELYKYLYGITISLYKQGIGDSRLVTPEARIYMTKFKNSELYSFLFIR